MPPNIEVWTDVVRFNRAPPPSFSGRVGRPSAAEIARAAGVSRRTLYLHFTTVEHPSAGRQ
jgi:hypothetical protein